MTIEDKILNAKIAEFFGCVESCKPVNEFKQTDYWQFEFTHNFEPYKSIFDQTELKFTSDWKWLLPVCKKIYHLEDKLQKHSKSWVAIQELKHAEMNKNLSAAIKEIEIFIDNHLQS